MPESSAPEGKPVLQPIERLSEILFGLIMVLTFTGSLSVANAEKGEVKVMLIGALGCNIAWGLIDAIMYLMGCLQERGAEIQTVRAVKEARSTDDAHAIIRGNVPRIVAQEMSHEILERVRARMGRMQNLEKAPRLSPDDLRGAAGVFLIVVVSTLPVVMPFLFTHDVAFAMRLSNTIAVGMLALIGFFFGRVSGLPPWWTALLMVLIGLVLVALTIALGG